MQPAVAQNSAEFKEQYYKEFGLMKENIDEGYDVKDYMVKVKAGETIIISLDDALRLAIKNNETIQSAIGSYMNALLSYQNTMFQFQFSAGSLTYNYSYEYQQKEPTLSIANNVSQTLPSGLQYNLTNTAQNNPSSSSSDLATNSNLILSQSIVGSTRASNQNTILSALESLAQAKLSLRNTLNETLTSITNQFRTVLFNEQSIANVLSNGQTVKKNIEKSQTQFDLGLISKNDLESIQLQEINSKLSLEKAKFELRNTLNTLKVNLGLSVEDKVKLTPDLKHQNIADKILKKIESMNIQHRKSFLRSTLVNSSTLISDRIQIRSYERSININYKKKNVQVNATGSLNYSSSNQTGSSQAALSMQLPLDNRSTVNAIRSNKTSLISTQQQFMHDCIELIRQETEAYDNVMYYLERTKLTGKQLSLSKDIDDASKIKFKYGAISATDVQQNHQDYLNAIENLREAENTYAQSVNNYRKLTDNYIQSLPVNLSHELDVIFQTVNIKANERRITTPSLKISDKDFTPDKPYEMCMALMNAEIINF